MRIARKKIARRVKVRNCMRTIANKQKAVGHWKEKWIFLQRVMVFLASSLCARVVHHTNQFFGQIEVGAECRVQSGGRDVVWVQEIQNEPICSSAMGYPPIIHQPMLTTSISKSDLIILTLVTFIAI